MCNPVKEYYKNGNIKYEEWYEDNQTHRIDGPAEIFYYKNGNIKYEEWYEYGKNHRFDGPAVIWYYKNGNIEYKEWHINGNEIKQPFDNYPLTIDQIIEMKLKYT